jgi:hypothetical protein
MTSPPDDRQLEAAGAEAGGLICDVLPGPDILSPAGLQPTALAHSRQRGRMRSIQCEEKCVMKVSPGDGDSGAKLMPR